MNEAGLSYGDIKKGLHAGVCNFTFTKKDNTERKMRGTLMDSFLPKVEGDGKVTSSKPFTEEVVTVWDIEAEAWRAFRTDSLLTFEVEE